MPQPKPPARVTPQTKYLYRMGRGEFGVLTVEPYKSAILPLWRFRTTEVAQKSSEDIYDKFLEYNGQDDFVGMDMCRKFLQMGMTRALRYANHAGGRKYDKETGEELEKSTSHDGREQKLQASLVFRKAWETAKSHRGYLEKKERFLSEQKEWEKKRKDDGSQEVC